MSMEFLKNYKDLWENKWVSVFVSVINPEMPTNNFDRLKLLRQTQAD